MVNNHNGPGTAGPPAGMPTDYGTGRREVVPGFMLWMHPFTCVKCPGAGSQAFGNNSEFLRFHSKGRDTNHNTNAACIYYFQSYSCFFGVDWKSIGPILKALKNFVPADAMKPLVDPDNDSENIVNNLATVAKLFSDLVANITEAHIPYNLDGKDNVPPNPLPLWNNFKYSKVPATDPVGDVILDLAMDTNTNMHALPHVQYLEVKALRMGIPLHKAFYLMPSWLREIHLNYVERKLSEPGVVIDELFCNVYAGAVCSQRAVLSRMNRDHLELPL
jgi:hypothetical protein